MDITKARKHFDPYGHIHQSSLLTFQGVKSHGLT
jgi:hypothetical protein